MHGPNRETMRAQYLVNFFVMIRCITGSVMFLLTQHVFVCCAVQQLVIALSRKYPVYWDKHDCTKTVDRNQTAPKEGLNCLPFCQQII